MEPTADLTWISNKNTLDLKKEDVKLTVYVEPSEEHIETKGGQTELTHECL